MARFTYKNITLSMSISLFSFLAVLPLGAQETIDLTFDKAVDITMESSYRIHQLQLGIERNRWLLKARQAQLKSSVSLNLQSPNINAMRENEWNSDLSIDQIVKRNNRRWQMDLSIRQPVILFGYPTNGYLSLNNKMYKYIQKFEGSSDVDFYNRYFISLQQPFFRPNTLKNDIERAELDLEDRELSYKNDLVRTMESIGYEYYRLFRYSYGTIINDNYKENLSTVYDIVSRQAEQDSIRVIEARQVEVELNNANVRISQNDSEIRLRSSQMKQRLRLDDADTIIIEPTISITPINVDLANSYQYGYTLRPSMRLLSIGRRRNEIDLENVKGWDKFYVNVSMTYGIEKKDDRYQRLWDEIDNSYSISVGVYFPIWDWGSQARNVEGYRIALDQADLDIEENSTSIKSEITLAVANLKEYQSRALSMKSNMESAREVTSLSIAQFKEGNLSVQDIMQIVEKQRETEENFLDAYLGYRNSLIRLMSNTHYDFEKDMPLVERFKSKNDS